MNALHLGTRILAATALVVLTACGSGSSTDKPVIDDPWLRDLSIAVDPNNHEAGDGVPTDGGPYVVVHSGRDAWVVDTAANVRDHHRLPEQALVRQPQPGTVSFLGQDAVWNVDLATGEIDTVTGLVGRRHALAEGQRLLLHSVEQDDHLSDAETTDSDQPGPEMLLETFDVLTGDRVTSDELVGGPAEVVHRTGHVVVLDVEGSDGLQLLRLDQAPASAVELPPAGLGDLHFSTDATTVALESGGELWVGDTAQELAPTQAARRIVGVVGEQALIDDGTALQLVAADGTRTAVRSSVTIDEVAHPSGLLRSGEDERARWHHLDGATVRPLPDVDGMELVAAGARGWWFGSGQQKAPLPQHPVIAVDPATGEVHPVVGTLVQLAALAEGGVETGRDDQHLRATMARTPRGTTELTFADASSGQVRGLRMLDEQIAVSHQSRHLASWSGTRLQVATLDGNRSTIRSANNIKAEGEDPPTLTWVLTE